MNAEERLLGRFKAEFETKNLANVKFFVRAQRVSVADLVDEINLFDDTVSAGDFKILEVVDSHLPTIRYDAPFE